MVYDARYQDSASDDLSLDKMIRSGQLQEAMKTISWSLGDDDDVDEVSFDGTRFLRACALPLGSDVTNLYRGR